MIKMSSSTKRLISICFILIITTLVFLPSLNNGFLNWDDQAYVTQNQSIRELSFKNLKNIFTSTFLGLYMPIVILSHTVEFHFFNLNPLPYHTHNLILHLINCILIFYLILILSKSYSISLLTTLLWGVHPLRVESVAWISDRKDLISSIFLLIALILYLIYREKPKKRIFFYFSLIIFIFALLSKITTVIFPLILILFDFYFEGNINKKKIIEKVPFFEISFIFGIIGMWVLKIDQPPTYLTISERILNVLISVPFYLSKIFLPLKLSPRYPIHANEIFPNPLTVFVLTIVVLIIIIYFSNKYRREFIFGFLFLLITLIPIIPLILDGFPHADRYTYISSIGIFYLISKLLIDLFNKKFKKKWLVRIPLLIFLSGILFTLSFLSWQKCHVWKNDITLWNDALKSYPTHIVYDNRGSAFAKKGYIDNAISDFSMALKIHPNYETFYNRGLAYSNKANYEKAIKDYNKSIELNPRYAKAFNNRGFAYAKKSKLDFAIRDYSSAIELAPNYIIAYFNRAIAYSDKCNFKQAISDFNSTIKINPKFLPSYYCLIEIYKKEQSNDKLKIIYKKISKLNHNKRNIKHK